MLEGWIIKLIITGSVKKRKKKEVKSLRGTAMFSLYNPELKCYIRLIYCCDVTAQEIKESTPKNRNTN